MKTYQRKLTGVIPIAAIALCLAPIPATYAQNAQSPDRRPPDTPPPVDSSANQPPISPRATDLPPPTGPLNPTAPDQPGVTRPSQEPSPASTLPVGDRTADRQQQQPSAQSTTATSADAIQVASSNAAANGVRQLAGQPVLTADGQNLGTLKDFIVDASSGKVAYGVVSSGGFLGAGDTLRAIPCDALQPAPGAEGFTVQLQPEQWSQVSAINEEDFNAGRIDISADQQRQISQVFGSTETNRAATPANADTRATRDTAATSGIASTSGGGLQFQRVSAIRGKNIHSGPQKVGNIEEVVIDLDQGTASALVDPANDFLATDAKYLVPIQRLNLASTDNVVTTTLARADFDQAQSQSVVVAATPPSVAEQTAPPTTVTPNEAPLSPTGRTSAEQNPQADAGLMESARAVRRALDEDKALATEKVQVTPEGGKLILRGSVPDQQTKSNVESTAKQAASTAQIENQIRVENLNR